MKEGEGEREGANGLSARSSSVLVDVVRFTNDRSSLPSPHTHTLFHVHLDRRGETEDGAFFTFAARSSLPKVSALKKELPRVPARGRF